MKTIVKAHPKTGLVITEGQTANGNRYGKFCVQQSVLEAGEGNIVNVRSRAAFITVFNDDIEKIKPLLQDGGEYPLSGKIVRTESRTPLYEGQEPKKNPKTNEIHLVDGAPVYFIDEWSSDMNAQDKLIKSSVEATVAQTSMEEEA